MRAMCVRCTLSPRRRVGGVRLDDAGEMARRGGTLSVEDAVGKARKRGRGVIIGRGEGGGDAISALA